MLKQKLLHGRTSLADSRTTRYSKSSTPVISIPDAAGKVFLLSHQNAYIMMVTVIANEIHILLSVGTYFPTLTMDDTSLNIDISGLSYSFTELTIIKGVQ